MNLVTILALVAIAAAALGWIGFGIIRAWRARVEIECEGDAYRLGEEVTGRVRIRPRRALRARRVTLHLRAVEHPETESEMTGRRVLRESAHILAEKHDLPAGAETVLPFVVALPHEAGSSPGITAQAGEGGKGAPAAVANALGGLSRRNTSWWLAVVAEVDGAGELEALRRIEVEGFG